jgi:hypothetical protein
MKLIFKPFIFIIYASIILFLKSSDANTDKNKFGTSVAAYALASTKTDQFFVQNAHNFAAPLLVKNLPPRTPIGDGIVTQVESIKGGPDVYYNGETNFRTNVSTCQDYTISKKACLHNGSCGWCGGPNSCIPGNAHGPHAECLRGTYSFADPVMDWNPLSTNDVSVQRQEILGAQLTKFITPK